uniref:BED-type domain-containing protein n=1 Tax=Myripristis murdjan TaxID=586833 RepID=A0A667X1D9_9TELE
LMNEELKNASTASTSKAPIYPPPPTLKASVWVNFGFYGRNSKNVDRTHAVCRHCHTKIKFCSNTTNLRAHVSRFHPEAAAVGRDDRLKPTIPPNQRTLHEMAKLAPGSERAKKITKAISYFIAKDMRPYSVVENQGFRYMVHNMEPRYVIPSRSFFTHKSIPSLYKETKFLVQESLKSATRVAITCDSWTSRATVSYVTVTAHHVNSEWKLISYVLRTDAMDDSHTGANMCEFLKTVADEWGLDKNDLVLVTDNASNMNLAAELGNFVHVRCYAHTLNLACQRALKLPAVARLLSRIRRITAFFHRSATASHVLEQNDAPTRWNSGFDMIDRFLEQQPAICAALLSPQVSIGFNEADVSGAEHLVKALKPMKLATTTMSEESTPTLSVIAPLHARLLTSFTPAPEDDPMTREIKHAIQEDLKKRYTSTKERHTLYTASALDPRFKTLPLLSEDERLDTYSRVTTEAASLEVEDDMVEKVQDKDLKVEEEGPSAPSTSKPSSLTALLGQTFTVVATVKPKTAQTRAEEEVQKYLEAPSLPLTDNPLEWWSTNEYVYPLLAMLAKRYLCIPGTSVAAERVFSTAGDIVSAQRSTLTPQHVDQLVFLQKNLVGYFGLLSVVKWKINNR